MDIIQEYLRAHGELIYWTDLHWEKERIDLILDVETAIIKNQEEFINRRKDDHMRALHTDKGFQSLKDTPKIQAQYEAHYYGNEENAIDEIRRVQRNATVLSIFSLLETELKGYCKMIDDEFNKQAFKDYDCSRNKIRKFLNYFIEVYGLNKNSCNIFFTSIEADIKLRNAIAHDNSTIKAKSHLLDPILKLEGLSGTQSDAHVLIEIISEEYLLNLITRIYQLLNSLIKLINIRYKELKGLPD